MLILSRMLGESLSFDGTILTVIRIGDRYVEMSLTDPQAAKPMVITLPHHQYTDVGHGVRVVLIGINGTKARLGMESTTDVSVQRID